MKAAMAFADMLDTAHTKNPSNRYFRPRRGRSTQRGRRKLRRKTFRPSFHKYSESVPTGHSQLQKALRNRKAMATKVTSRNMAAGCRTGTRPVSRKYFRF